MNKRYLGASLRTGVAVVDCKLKVLIWNRMAEDMWGLRGDEVRDQFLLNLDIGLPVAQLKDMVNVCLAGEADKQENVLDATTRRGRAIRCKVTCTSLTGRSSECPGAVLLMEEENK